MNLERLQRVVDLLSAPLPPRTKFSIEHFIKHKSCGTVCCAIGLAMQDPWCQEQGLNTMDNEGMLIPYYQDEKGHWAISRFFGISLNDTGWLFYPQRYTTPPTRATVRKRIRTLMESAR